ncbi:hypothetical protein AGIG_G18958 [Arapaima gigas]
MLNAVVHAAVPTCEATTQPELLLRCVLLTVDAATVPHLAVPWSPNVRGGLQPPSSAAPAGEVDGGETGGR